MSNRSWPCAVVVLALIGGTAIFLNTWKANQRLGKPGVKVAQEPVFSPEGKIVGTNSVSLPAKVLDFQSEVLPVSQVVLGWLPKDTVYGQRVYKAPDDFYLQMSVVLMGTDRTSIHKPQYCLTGAGFEITRTEGMTVPIASPHPYELPVMRILATHEKARGVFVYWFVADGQITADHNQRMWWMARDMMRQGVLQRWAYVTLFCVCPPGQEEATYARMKDFISAAVPTFQLASGSAASLARNP